jgi:dolichol-phosphate mannosyltransferase
MLTLAEPKNESDRESNVLRYASPIAKLNTNTTHTELSFVIPVMDEEATLEELVRGIAANIPAGKNHEIILIDDGSTDDSWQVIQALADIHSGLVSGIRFRANCGKAAALAAGFEAAGGDVIFTMDADLQDDPSEIPRFLSKLDEGYDLVSGWKQVRHDPWHKVLPSRVFNRMLSRFSRVKLHDHNCGFKCYRREVAKSIRLFGELHRMVPALSGIRGFRVTEIPVQHHPRRFGKSKYGIERFIRGLSDMLTVGFLRVYRERPSHFANTCAVAYSTVAFALLALSVLIGITTFQGTLAALVGLCFLGMGGASVIAGLFAELMIRTPHQESAATSIVRVTNTVSESRDSESRLGSVH